MNASTVVSFDEFVAAAGIAFAASERLNSRLPVFSVDKPSGVNLYCGWRLSRAVRTAERSPKAVCTLCTFDIDGAPLFVLTLAR